MKNISFTLSPASLILFKNDVGMLVPSMVASTVLVLAVMTVAPWMFPLLSMDVTRSRI